MLCDLKVLRCRFIAQSVSLALIVIGSLTQSQKTLHADQLPTSAMQAATAIQFESVQLKFKPPGVHNVNSFVESSPQERLYDPSSHRNRYLVFSLGSDEAGFSVSGNVARF